VCNYNLSDAITLGGAYNRSRDAAVGLQHQMCVCSSGQQARQRRRLFMQKAEVVAHNLPS